MNHPAPEELVARAATRRVVVVGGGVSGLIAARECAKVGMQVTLVEASDQLGGAIRTAELDGVAIDAGAESFATRGGHVRALIDELGLGDQVVAPEGGGAWLAGIPGTGAAPLPKGGLLGIPANPFTDDVRRIIGWGGAWRAYVDRLRPPLTIGHERSLGRLVATRMGAKVLDRLVAPITGGVYSAHPNDVDVEAAAPGLSAALTRTGSLSGAVQTLVGQRATHAKAPGSAVEGISGGMGRLVDALRADLATFDVDVRTRSRVARLRRDGERWQTDVQTDAVGAALTDDEADAVAEAPARREALPADAAHGDAADVAAAQTETVESDAVILAVTEDIARDLLAEIIADLGEKVESPQVEIVSLLLDAPELDAAPRGTGVLTVPGSHTAKALTHGTAKWGWLREQTGGRHVVRVSFGAQGEEPATSALDDAAAAELAATEAAAMLGVPLRPSQVIASHRERFTQSQPASLIGAADRRAAVRKAVAAVPGLAVVGAWVAGTGLAQVIPDAAKEADRLRRTLLWD